MDWAESYALGTSVIKPNGLSPASNFPRQPGYGVYVLSQATNSNGHQSTPSGSLLGSPSIKEGEPFAEEESKYKSVPDYLKENLDMVVVSINPSLTSAQVGHHYSGPGNHFWTCISQSGLVPLDGFSCYDDSKMPDYGIGFTNICSRPTKGASELSRTELKVGSAALLDKMQRYRPKIVVFNGKGVYEVYAGHKNFNMGKQPATLEGTNCTVFVMPSSSARCAQLPRAEDKLPFFNALRKLRDFTRGLLPSLSDADCVFSDYTEFRITQPDPKSLRKAERRRKRKAEQLAAAAASSAQGLLHSSDPLSQQLISATNIGHSNGQSTLAGQQQMLTGTPMLADSNGLVNAPPIDTNSKKAPRRKRNKRQSVDTATSLNGQTVNSPTTPTTTTTLTIVSDPQTSSLPLTFHVLPNLVTGQPGSSSSVQPAQLAATPGDMHQRAFIVHQQAQLQGQTVVGGRQPTAAVNQPVLINGGQLVQGASPMVPAMPLATPIQGIQQSNGYYPCSTSSTVTPTTQPQFQLATASSNQTTGVVPAAVAGGPVNQQQFLITSPTVNSTTIPGSFNQPTLIQWPTNGLVPTASQAAWASSASVIGQSQPSTAYATTPPVAAMNNDHHLHLSTQQQIVQQQVSNGPLTNSNNTSSNVAMVVGHNSAAVATPSIGSNAVVAQPQQIIMAHQQAPTFPINAGVGASMATYAPPPPMQQPLVQPQQQAQPLAQQVYLTQTPGGTSYQLLPVGCPPSNFIVPADQQSHQLYQQQPQLQIAQQQLQHSQTQQYTLQIPGQPHPQQQANLIQHSQLVNQPQQATLTSNKEMLTSSTGPLLQATASPQQFIALPSGTPVKLMTIGSNGQLIQSTTGQQQPQQQQTPTQFIQGHQQLTRLPLNTRFATPAQSHYTAVAAQNTRPIMLAPQSIANNGSTTLLTTYSSAPPPPGVGDPMVVGAAGVNSNNTLSVNLIGGQSTGSSSSLCNHPTGGEDKLVYTAL